MRDTLFTIGFLLLGIIGMMAHTTEDSSTTILKKNNYHSSTPNICFLLPQYTVTLRELENGRYILEIDVTSMGRADELRVSFFYGDIGINETISTTGVYEVGVIGFNQPQQNGFFHQDNIHIFITEQSTICNIQNESIFNRIILPESVDPAEDNCQLKFIGTNEDNSCFYQEEHWLRANTSSNRPACNGTITPSNDLIIKIPIPAAGEVDFSIINAETGQPLVVNHEVYKGKNCENNSTILSCQSGSEINVGPYRVGEFLFFRIWMDDLVTDQLIRFCIQGTTCNLPTYSISTQKDCNNNTVDKTISISDLGDAASLDIYFNDALIHSNVIIGDYEIPTFPPCSKAQLKIEASNIFCGLIEDFRDICTEQSTCATAIELTEQQSSNYIYTSASTCGKEPNLPQCGGFFLYPMEWFKFTALSSNPNIWINANFDREVNIYTGSCSGNMTFYTCYHQSKGERKNSFNLNLNIGETYYVVVYNNSFSRQYGPAASFEIAVQSDAALAVELTNFKGISSLNVNVLQWTMAYQQDIAYFIIEKSQTGLEDWTPIQTVFSTDNKSPFQQYKVTDNTPFIQTFYRLKIVAADGSIHHSKIIQVQQLNNFTIQQVNNQVYINNNTIVNSSIQLQVSNVNGQLILQQSLTGKDMQIDINNWNSGIYFLMLNDGQQQWSEKIIKR